MSTTVRRPFGVSLISVIIIIGGVLDIIGGILTISFRNDVQLLIEMKATKNEALWFGIFIIAIGVLAILVGLWLWKGSNVARLLVGVVVALRLIGTVWAFASFDKFHWYEGLVPLVIYAVVAYYLLAGPTAKQYTDSHSLSA